jgi:hypothetical protein
MSPRTQAVIDIFLDAINRGTLAKGSCICCAVGNICAHYSGYEIPETWRDENKKYPHTAWSNLFCTVDFEQDLGYLQEDYSESNRIAKEEGKAIIAKTPFTVSELAKVEFVFETNTDIVYGDYPLISAADIRKDQIKGLEAVVRLLLSWDNTIETTEEVFTNKVELIPVQ